MLADPVAKARRTLAGLAAYDRSVTGEPSATNSLVPQISLDDEPKEEATTAIPLIPMDAPNPAREEMFTDAERKLRIRKWIEQDMRHSLSLRYGALIAAGRDKEALRLADSLLSHLDDELSRIALVTQAIAAGVAQEHTERHVRWLEEALK